MTALAEILKAQIAATGPMSLADYMHSCLLHPQHGYYTTRDPLGAGGDFTTAPEISQMFGELIGLALAQTWLDHGAPAKITLAELGPGRGTLMADILRATRGVRGFHAAVCVHLIEASPTLRAAQAKLVPNATWHDHMGTLPDAPLYLVANEFFDALPIRQFIRDSGGWRETMIGLDGDTLTRGLSSAAPIDLLEDRLDDTAIGDIIEHCPALPAYAQDIGTRITANGGCALIIDYGQARSLGDTFQALTAHTKTDPLATPGASDLTAHVAFDAIVDAAPCAHTQLTPQGVFLERLGITQRAQSLANALRGDALENHIAAHRRLTHPAEMGELFKVLGLYPADKTPPPGLDI